MVRDKKPFCLIWKIWLKFSIDDSSDNNKALLFAITLYDELKLKNK